MAKTSKSPKMSAPPVETSDLKASKIIPINQYNQAQKAVSNLLLMLARCQANNQDLSGVGLDLIANGHPEIQGAPSVTAEDVRLALGDRYPAVVAKLKALEAAAIA